MSRYKMYREDTWDILDENKAQTIATFHDFEAAVAYMVFLKEQTDTLQPEYEVDGFKYDHFPHNVLPKNRIRMRLVSEWFTQQEGTL